MSNAQSRRGSRPNDIDLNVDTPVERRDTDDLRLLNNVLHKWHIYAIGFSGTIGAGALIGTGTSLQISGPLATIFAYIFMGLVALCVSQCIADMVGTWPTANPFVLLVEYFIDKDLGLLVGIAYWYTYAMGFQTLIIATANLADLWGLSPSIKALVLFVACPFALVVINLFGVEFFANIELVAAGLKFHFIAVTVVLMSIVNAGGIGDHVYIGSQYFNDGFQHNPGVAKNILTAFSESIVIAAFAFIGIEIAAVTASETERKAQLREPINWIAPITIAVYVLTVGVLVSNVKWCDEHLPRLWDQDVPPASFHCEDKLIHATRSLDSSATAQQHVTNVSPVRGYGVSIATIALKEAGCPKAAAFVNGCLIFAVLSAANTALYVASRTLFGLTRRIEKRMHHEEDHPARKWIEDFVRGILRKFGTLHPGTKVPAWAIIGSWLVFCWIPFIELRGGRTLLHIQEILATLGSVSCVLVWASQCAAFLFYWRWCKEHPGLLRASNLAKFDRKHYNGPDRIETLMSFAQPLVAWFGLVGCLVIALILTTGTWWKGQVSARRFASVYLFPVVMILFYAGLKIRRRLIEGEWQFVNHRKNDFMTLRERLGELKIMARENRTDEQNEEAH